MRKWIICIGIILGILKTGKSQTARLDSLINDVMFGDDLLEELFKPKTNYHFLYARTNVDTKTFYAGREINDNMTNATAQVMYFNSKGLYASVAGYWYSNSDPNYSMTLASLGYSNSFKFYKNLRYRASYDHFFYNLTGTDFSPSYFGSVNLGTSFRYKWAGASVDASMLVGDEFKTTYSASIFTKFVLLKMGKRGKLTARPRVNFYIGVEDIENIIYTDVDNIEFTYQQQTGLMNTQLMLPLDLTLGNFDFSAAIRYNMPRSLDPAYEYNNTIFYSISAGYFFAFN